ncbi:hypothetical protein PENSTE_c031G02064 [Penicillium steckii]|uniref:Uncharacterized protein n=1 Tax=Penicillium steckii TaxID=303698 RepID=A0A1V6SLK2_9EURO|nr:hypothetical protein PENSTE_c031G02064 [Penicillium steckii]
MANSTRNRREFGQIIVFNTV